MARPPRNEAPGAIHHVFARGVGGQDIFRDVLDHEAYLAMLEAVIRRCRWRLLTYCLMTNHVHLLIETPEPNLGRGMQRLHGDYARDFNDRYGRRGHVFEQRYGNVPVEDDAQLLTVVRYIAMNPVDAGLCGRPGEWPWSGHFSIAKAWAAPWHDIDRLYELLRAWSDDARKVYLDFVEAGPPS